MKASKKNEPIIEVKHLSKKYNIGVDETYKTLSSNITSFVKNPLKILKDSYRPNNTFWALKDVNFTIDRGEVVGIIGKNGAGKSTLLKVLSRITYPTEGEVRMHGRVGSLLEVGTGFHPELSGRENVYFNGAILGMKKKEIDDKFDDIVKFSGVEKFLDIPVKRYSSGMNVRLAFAVAAHLDPEILLIDEVLSVGDSEFQKKCLGKMDQISHEGRTLIVVSHDMELIENLCTEVYVLDEGKIINCGDPVEMINNYSVLAGGGQGEIIHVSNKKLSWKGIYNRSQLSNLTPDSDITLSLSFESGNEDIEEFYVDCEIHDENNEIIIHNKSKHVGNGFSIAKNSKFTIDYFIESPKLTTGDYYLTMYIYSGPEIILWIDRIKAFHVNAKNYFGCTEYFDGLKSNIIPRFHYEMLIQ